MGVVAVLVLAFALVAIGPGHAARTVAHTPPWPPELLSATAGDDSVILTWAPPANDGGSPVTGYRIARTGTTTTTVAIVDGSRTTYTGHPLNGRSYTYVVYAANASGEGYSPSNALIAAPISPTPTLLTRFLSRPLGAAAVAAAVGDVTGDGRRDVVVTTDDWGRPERTSRSPSSCRKRTEPGRPALYAPSAAYGTRALSVATGDVTGDGRADVIVGMRNTGVEVFRQLASGVLGSPTSIPITGLSAVAVGQLDGTGPLDIAVAAGQKNVVEVLPATGGGGFGAPSVQTVAGLGGTLEVGDVTGDDRDDVVVSTRPSDVASIAVLAQTSGGGLGNPVSYPVGTDVTGIGIGDANDDGRDDVVAAYGGSDGRLAVLAQAAGGGLASGTSSPIHGSSQGVTIGDLDGDGRDDVVVSHGDALGVSLQQPDATWTAEKLYLAAFYGYADNALGLADVNGDGTTDVVGVVPRRAGRARECAPRPHACGCADAASGSERRRADALQLGCAHRRRARQSSGTGSTTSPVATPRTPRWGPRRVTRSRGCRSGSSSNAGSLR